MLFLVVQTHSHEHCPAHKPEAMATIMKAMGDAQQHGVKIVASYIDSPAHTNFIVLETDSADKLQRFFDPMLDHFNCAIHPVVDTMAAFTRLQKEN